MKRRGFLKLLGISAAVPIVAKAGLPETNGVQFYESPSRAADLLDQLNDNALLASLPGTMRGVEPVFTDRVSMSCSMATVAELAPYDGSSWTILCKGK